MLALCKGVTNLALGNSFRADPILIPVPAEMALLRLAVSVTDLGLVSLDRLTTRNLVLYASNPHKDGDCVAVHERRCFKYLLFQFRQQDGLGAHDGQGHWQRVSICGIQIREIVGGSVERAEMPPVADPN
ncbi:hypothetical protein C8F04DRAFT_1189404 [Mycena alexandri]|uniref:Uncharacterized protein n=1 Tax=Mycena alexandri TaxID=1745969 RepID=A0AAD6SHH0_9AGAR|nr:hypothetical protein C8F04DRAFT_1189404 [Mycena alexandri]